jgi:two-component system sensor histidine kinase BaeS
LASFHYQLKDHNLNLQLQLPLQPVFIQGDALRLQQLLNNLLTNSLKYTHQNGILRVNLRTESPLVYLTIEDSAPGVPSDTLPHLFDYLFRLETSRNRQSGGSGLGLTIAKRIVEAHHGHIHAENSQLGGLKIVIILLLYEEAA